MTDGDIFLNKAVSEVKELSIQVFLLLAPSLEVCSAPPVFHLPDLPQNSDFCLVLDRFLFLFWSGFTNFELRKLIGGTALPDTNNVGGSCFAYLGA